MTRTPDLLRPEDIDWGRPETLVRFALMCRVDTVCDGLGWNRGDVAVRLGTTSSGLHEKLTAQGLVRKSTPDFVRDLQRFLHVREAQLRRGGREVFSFYEFVMNRWATTETLRVPSTFFVPLLSTGASNNYEEVLVRAAALAGIRRQGFGLEEARRLRRLYSNHDGRDLISDTVDELLTVIGMTHPDRNLAIRLAAELEDWVLPAVDVHNSSSPIGWRSLQVLTRMLRLYEDRLEEDRTQYLFTKISTVLKAAVDYQSDLPDPGRVFLEEALRRTPGERAAMTKRSDKGPYQTWAWPWVPKHLHDVALDASRSMRQRSYAALCLARRAQSLDDAQRIAEALYNETLPGAMYASGVVRQAVADRRTWSPQRVDERTIVLDRGVLANGELPEVQGVVDYFDFAASDPERLPEHLRAALGSIPRTVRIAAQVLMLEAVLSLDATRRRMACDTLIAAGAEEETTLVLNELVRSAETPDFLRENILVVLGYLGHKQAIAMLADQCKGRGPDSHTAAAAIALGEIHLDRDDGELARTRLEALAPLTSSRDRRVQRAASLSLAVLSEQTTRDDRRESLSRLLAHRTPAPTRKLAQWATTQLDSEHVVKAVDSSKEALESLE